MATDSLFNDIQVAATNQLVEALVESDRRMRRRLELMSDVVFELDRKGGVVFLNPAWAFLTGIPLQQVMGHSLEEHVLQDDRAAFAKALQSAGAKTAGHKTLLRLVHCSGHTVWTELTLVAIDTGHVGALHDISAQKRFQDQLEYNAN